MGDRNAVRCIGPGFGLGAEGPRTWPSGQVAASAYFFGLNTGGGVPGPPEAPGGGAGGAGDGAMREGGSWTGVIRSTSTLVTQ